MTAPIVTVDDSIAKVWDGLCLGCITYSVEIQPKNQELWDYYESSLATSLQQKLSVTDLAQMPQIGEARAAFKAFGIDPGRYRISSEALYRRIRQGKPLYQINSLVDANNVLSLQTGFSLGSYDASCIGSNIVFRLGVSGESYAGIGKAEIALENVPVLADGTGPFGSPISDSTRGMITPKTKEALTVIYSFSGRAALDDALQLTKRLFAEAAFATGIRACSL